MIKRNCFGELEPTIGKFYIEKYMGVYRVMKYEAHCSCRTDAYLRNPALTWIEIEPFSSLVQAYKFLKENVDNLI